MDGLMHFLTVEVGLFVRHLKSYSNIEDVQITPQLKHLLCEAIRDIERLIAKAALVNTTGQDILKLINDFDERKYTLRRYFECRICCEPIEITVDEYENHAQQNHQNFHDRQSIGWFSPDISPKLHTINGENKMAPINTIHDEIYHTNDAVDTTPFPKYSDVISQGLSQGSGSPSPNSFKSDDSPVRDTSIDSGYGTMYLIKVRGLPWKTTKKDLVEFFANVNIYNGLDGIHFVTDDENNFGVAYIQLSSRKDYDLAQSFHRKKLDERYIEVIKASKKDFEMMCDLQKSSANDYTLRLKGLPWISKEQEIRLFFSGLQTTRIDLILDKLTDQTLEAFVQFATSEDFDCALKRNWDILGNRHVKIFRSSHKQMQLKMRDNEQNKQGSPTKESEQKEKTKVKDKWQKVSTKRAKAEARKSALGNVYYMVMARGFPWSVTKQDVTAFFKGIKIHNNDQGINIMKNVAMEAYVELTTRSDVRKALELNAKKFETRTVYVNEVNAKDLNRVASNITQNNESNVVKIRGLPWDVDKKYIMDLFPSIKINSTNIQIEIDEHKRRTGYAFVAFDNTTDYELAFTVDFKAINQYIILFKATKEEYESTLKFNKQANLPDK